MLGIKILIYSFIFLTCSIIGLLKSKKFIYRVDELKEFKNALNMFKAKIKFTYEPLPEIFEQISNNMKPNIANIFKQASNNMRIYAAGEAWNMAIDMEMLNINLEDKNILKNLGKLLGVTDVTGQISQIEVTSCFLDEQIKKAENEREKSEKMYRKLGMIVGLGIVIVLL